MTMKLFVTTAHLLLCGLTISGCSESSSEKDVSQGMFPKGELGPAKNFTGKAWNTSLVPDDST